MSHRCLFILILQTRRGKEIFEYSNIDFERKYQQIGRRDLSTRLKKRAHTYFLAFFFFSNSMFNNRNFP